MSYFSNSAVAYQKLELISHRSCFLAIGWPQISTEGRLERIGEGEGNERKKLAKFNSIDPHLPFSYRSARRCQSFFSTETSWLLSWLSKMNQLLQLGLTMGINRGNQCRLTIRFRRDRGQANPKG